MYLKNNIEQIKHESSCEFLHELEAFHTTNFHWDKDSIELQIDLQRNNYILRDTGCFNNTLRALGKCT